MAETSQSREKLLQDYAALPDQLLTAVNGLSETQLDLTGSPDGWSIRQIIHHLAGGQTMWVVCMRMAISAPGSAIQFDWFPGNDAWSERMRLTERSIAPSLTLLQALHQETAESLTLIPDAWDRQVVIGVPGSGDERAFSVAQIVNFTAEHFVGHLAEIAAIIKTNDSISSV
jgi:uncharacterized damage-inducible protein DinB